MLLLLSLLTLVFFAHVGAVEVYYNPSGPRVRLQIITSTNEVLYLRRSLDDFLAGGTTDQASASVFTYDTGQTNAFFEPSISAPSGWMLWYYVKDASLTYSAWEDSKDILDFPWSYNVAPLPCIPTTVGADTLVCGHPTTFTRSSCLEPGAEHYLVFYDSGSSTLSQACGTDGIQITSFKLEYVDSVTTTSSSSSSSSSTSSSSSSSSTSAATSLDSHSLTLVSESVSSQTRRSSGMLSSISAMEMSSTRSFQPTSSIVHELSSISVLETLSPASTLMSPDRTSNLVSSASITTSSSIQEQPFASPTAGISTLSLESSENLTGTKSSDYATSHPSTSTSTSQPASDDTQPSPTLPSVTPGRSIIGIEKIFVVIVFSVLEPRHLLHRRQRSNDFTTRTVSILHRDIYTVPIPGQPYYPAVIGYPEPGEMLTVTTISTLNAPPDPTPKFAYQLCSDCAPIFVIRAVPGYVPGACNGCILDAVFDLPSSNLDVYSSTSTGNTLSRAPGPSITSMDASSIRSLGLSSSHPSSPISTPSDAIDTGTTTASADEGGLVTVVTGTETLTQTITSMIYLPDFPGDGGLDRVVTICYPVTTCSEFTATPTVPPESCTTYTTTNEADNRVETCTEPVPWWTPTFPTQTQLPATGSQDTGPENPDASNPGSATNSLAESAARSNFTPHPGAGNKVGVSPGSQTDDVPIYQANAAPSGGEAEDDVPKSGGQEVEMMHMQEGRPSSVPSSPSGADPGVGNTTSEASDNRADIGTPSAVAQSIGYKARKTTGIEELIFIIGLMLLLVCP